MSKTIKPEAATQRLILDWLAANHIWHERRNTGAVVSSYKGKKRLTRFSRPGTADIQATVMKLDWMSESTEHPPVVMVVWIEVKSATGRKSKTQIQFQDEVESYGHHYILARSLDDVITAMKGLP